MAPVNKIVSVADQSKPDKHTTKKIKIKRGKRGTKEGRKIPKARKPNETNKSSLKFRTESKTVTHNERTRKKNFVIL